MAGIVLRVITGEYIDSLLGLEIYTVIKMSRQGKPTRNTAPSLFLKNAYGKNVWRKTYWNHFPVWLLGFMGSITHTVVLYCRWALNDLKRLGGVDSILHTPSITYLTASATTINYIVYFCSSVIAMAQADSRNEVAERIGYITRVQSFSACHRLHRYQCNPFLSFFVVVNDDAIGSLMQGCHLETVAEAARRVQDGKHFGMIVFPVRRFIW